MVNEGGGWSWVELWRQYGEWPGFVGEDILLVFTAVLVTCCHFIVVDIGSHCWFIQYLKLSAPVDFSVELRLDRIWHCHTPLNQLVSFSACHQHVRGTSWSGVSLLLEWSRDDPHHDKIDPTVKHKDKMNLIYLWKLGNIIDNIM